MISASLTENALTKNKRNIFIILIIVLASTPLTYLIMHMGHDSHYHLNRICALSDSLFQHFQFPLRISSYYFNGYGYASSIYYPDFFLYLPAILNGLGCMILPEQSDKILLISYQCYVLFINILTTIIAYYSFKKISKSSWIAIVVTAVYVLNPYRWVSIYTRTAVGEYTAMAFLPLVASSIYSIYTSENSILQNALSLSLAMTGIMQSHIITTEFTAILLIVIALIFFKKTFTKDVLITYFYSIILFLFLNAFFIIPFLDYMFSFDANINNTIQSSNTVQFHGIYPSQYIAFFSSLDGVSNPDLYDMHLADRFQMTPGITLMASLIYEIFRWGKKQNEKKDIALLILTTTLIIMSTIFFPWRILIQYTHIGKILSAIQFPWRLLGYIVIILSILLTSQLISLQKQKKLYVKILAVISFVSALMVCWYNSDMVNRMDFKVSKFPSSFVVGVGEYLPNGTDLTLCDGKCSDNVASFVQNGTQSSVSVKASSLDYVEIPVFNYKYFEAYDSDGTPLNITNGLNNTIRISIPASYIGNIDVILQTPVVWRIAEYFSLVSAIAIICLLIKIFIKKNEAHR